MIISRLLRPGFNSLILILLMASQITSCSTEGLAELADNIITDNASIEESEYTIESIDTEDPNIFNTTSDSRTETPTVSSPTSDSSTETPTASNPTPDSSTEAPNVYDPTSGSGDIRAMYSYKSDLSNPNRLNSAVLDQRTVYIYFTNVSKFSSMDFYCCRGESGESKGEEYKPPVSDSSRPFVHEVDLSDYTTAGERRFYAKAWFADGSEPDILNVKFSINVTTGSTSPEPEPEPEPEPTPKAVDVSLSWTAPAEREDGDSISPSQIAGFKVYYGSNEGNYDNNVDVNDHTATDYIFKKLTAGTYYFVVTTYDVDGLESEYSAPIQVDI